MTDCCPHCKRPYAPALRVTGPVRRRIVLLVANRPDGITAGDLANLVYADRPNGEPEWAANSIKCTIHYANKELAPQGYRIKSDMGPGARYRLERIFDIASDRAKHKMWSEPFELL
jgi:hypothetical protein